MIHLISMYNCYPETDLMCRRQKANELKLISSSRDWNTSHQDVQEIPQVGKPLSYEFVLCNKTFLNTRVCPHPTIGLRMFSMNILYYNDISC